jgi:shikimate kinase
MQQRNKMKLKRSIVLVGIMGCGKSAIGSRLAMALEVPFIDLDHEIEKNEGRSISEIFAQNGEAYFRKLEKDTLNEILNTKLCVLATGGGAFMNIDSRALIKKISDSVCITADFEVLLERVSRKNTRPLLETGDKATILKDLIAKRSPTYALADITVDSSSGMHEDVVAVIIEELRKKNERS